MANIVPMDKPSTPEHSLKIPSLGHGIERYLFASLTVHVKVVLSCVLSLPLNPRSGRTEYRHGSM